MKDKTVQEFEKMAEQLHIWYLEAVKELDPHFFNLKAQVAYKDLHEKQKDIDRYIAKKLASYIEKREKDITEDIILTAKFWDSEYRELEDRIKQLEDGLRKIRGTLLNPNEDWSGMTILNRVEALLNKEESA